MKILKFAVISVFLLLILGAHSAFAADQTYFSDEFDGTSLDSTKWQSYQNNGSIQVNGGVIQLSSGRTSTFPYVYSKNNPFPETGDFSLEFTIQYTNISPWGTGFVVGTQTPVNATNPTGDIFNFWVWQDTTTGNQGFRLNFGPDKQVIYSKLTQDYTKHTVKLDYASGIYKVFLDNSLIYTSGQMNLRPKVIWFGNPVDVHSIPDWNWTAFQLDYVRVLTLESQKTPLIFIPGIGGSELKVTQDTIWNKDNGHGGTYNRAYSAGEKVWVNEGEAAAIGDDDYFDVLRMKPDGQTSEANLELTGSMYAGSYQQAIDFFVANGYTLNQNLFIFPYDWRKDIALTSPLLDQKI